ncbi:MAG TPA: DNA polymerase III subunit gamma/tau [Terracidiphilus sp.]|nr:DNA polymerase III subunit gamma/tau [Terracidiphilus sp.]
MGYQVLARKYRPQRFADVAGQDHVTRTLMNALEQNRIAHGYIFSGHRGIGKTTIARILAQALNCRNAVGSTERPTPEPCGICDSCVEIRQGNAVDVIEIDAATNRGIDEIRELRDAARYSPARDRYKIYILDEAHQITEAAFNALLKTLEEPPAHVIFMMATTEPENIPQTIRSRCQHFSFHAVKFDDILAQLKSIAAREAVEAEEAALALLAEAGDGSMRDALSIMDQAIASAPMQDGRPVLAAAQIRELMGSVPNAVFERLLEAVAACQSVELMEQLNVLLNAGHSPLSLARQMVRYLRNCLMAKLGGEQTELLQISADERARAARTSMLFTEEEITRNLQIVLRTFDDLNFRQEQRFHLELGLLKLIHAQRLLPIEELLSGVAGGVSPRGAAPSGTPRPSTASRLTPAPASVPASASKTTPPSISPFTSSSVREAPAVQQSSAVTVAAVSAAVEVASVSIAETPSDTAQETKPFPPVSISAGASGAGSPLTDGALAKVPVASPTPLSGSESAPEIDALRQAVVTALAGAGHSSAAQLLGAGTWSIDGSNLRIEAPGMGKKMLSLTVNAAAEKIIKQELQRLGGPARFLVVPGAGSGSATAAVAAPIAGSIQEEALAHPLVQKAREIFHAEVRSVVDLRQK